MNKRSILTRVLSPLSILLLTSCQQDVIQPSVPLMSFAGENGRIVFSSNRTGNLDIYTMNADGTDVRQLTNALTLDAEPAWSPDGTRIAFVSDRDGNREIYVMNADGSNQIRLTNHPAADEIPTWSPKGDEIAFQSNRAADGRFHIFVVQVAPSKDGTHAVEQLTFGDMHESWPTWAPHGQLIAFTRSAGPNILLAEGDLYVVHRHGGWERQVTSEPGMESQANWSPDGRELLYWNRAPVQNANGTTSLVFNLYRRDWNSGETIQLTRNTNPAVWYLGPTFSPDGELIALSSQPSVPGHSFQTWLMNADGSGLWQLTQGPALNAQPDWQPIRKRDRRHR